MGAWGLKSFENDDAGDWVLKFDEEGVELIKTTFDAALDDSEEEVESYTSCEALAAAEIVAAAATGNTVRLSGEAETALQNHASALTSANHLALARDAVDRIKKNSELRELWQETDEFNDWIKDVEALEKLLG